MKPYDSAAFLLDGSSWWFWRLLLFSDWLISL